MNSQSQAQNPIEVAAASGVMLFAETATLPDLATGTAPEWVTVFPRLGAITCRDGRKFTIDAEKLCATFRADGLKLPIDVNHATDLARLSGGAGEAHGWITELRIAANALEARVDWLDSGKALLAARKYPYTSPSFLATPDGLSVRLMALALVTAPALAHQPALASAQFKPEKPMKTVTAALGLTEDASEAALLAAVTELKSKVGVPQAIHDKALADLGAATTELATLRADSRKAKVQSVLEEALAAKKIVPAERQHYEALCATDEGLVGVTALLAAKAPMLAGSGLDDRKVVDGEARTPVQLAAEANKLVAEGHARDIAEAMTLVTEKRA